MVCLRTCAGLPIRPVFSKPLPDRKSLRKTLGINTHLPTVLLVGGGEGMGALEDTVSQLDTQLGSKAQVVVICGRNKQLLATLSTKQQPNGLLVKACGFVDNIHEWMAVSDAIITKVRQALQHALPIFRHTLLCIASFHSRGCSTGQHTYD